MNFDNALALVLTHEGGFADHEKDRGGKTNYGITQATYNRYRMASSLPSRDVNDIGNNEINDIYQESYWDACRCYDLPWMFAYPTFDAAVSCGPNRARMWLQQGLSVLADGIIGKVTITAAKASGPDKVFRVIEARSDFISDLVKHSPGQAVFLKGWNRRMLDVLQESLS